jgi:hypothetical protein
MTTIADLQKQLDNKSLDPNKLNKKQKNYY